VRTSLTLQGHGLAPVKASRLLKPGDMATNNDASRSMSNLQQHAGVDRYSTVTGAPPGGVAYHSGEVTRATPGDNVCLACDGVLAASGGGVAASSSSSSGVAASSSSSSSSGAAASSSSGTTGETEQQQRQRQRMPRCSCISGWRDANGNYFEVRCIRQATRGYFWTCGDCDMRTGCTCQCAGCASHQYDTDAE
jgi:hypothetical protein